MKVDIERLVDNITKRANVYTPLVEAIVNSIQSIDKTNRKDGEIVIILKRDPQSTTATSEDVLSPIISVEIIDNGIGFNDENTESFDTLYSRLKLKEGGKGFGRYMYLEYFQDVLIESVFKIDNNYFKRSFDVGKNNQMIANPVLNESTLANDTNTVLHLNSFKKKDLLDKKRDTIARRLLEKLLIYFVNDDYICPKIILREKDEKDIILNDYLSNKDGLIKLIGNTEFTLEQDDISEKFQIKVFKIFFPNNQKSKISLIAHNREVTSNPIHDYIPEFIENFYDQNEDGSRKDYMIKTYVLGKYLDDNVSLERITFNFHKTESDNLYKFSQKNIEQKASETTKDLDIFDDQIKTRQNKKFEKINDYINSEAPWYKCYLKDINLSSIPYNLTEEDIDSELHRVKMLQEKDSKMAIKEILNNPEAEITKDVENLINKISQAETSDLVHYVALRKIILNLFKKSLEITPAGKYSSENAVHNIIFPTRSDSDTTPFDNHNLWILDEKLSFTEHVSSDQPLNGEKTSRTDLLIFDKKMAFRGENEESNPITIFEFKKPQRDDFVNPSSQEDPIQQVIRYVNEIKDGKYKTPKGRSISVGSNTPFYGFVVCDLTQKVKDWLLREKDFKPMPDSQGWFQWFSNNNLYIEVLSWDKVLKNAEMRNKIFFKKLGIN